MSGSPSPAAERLRTLRRSAGLTQEDLAVACGITDRTVRNLEAGTALRPRRDTLERIGQALGLDGDAFLRFVDSWRSQERGPRAIDAMFDAIELGSSLPSHLDRQRTRMRNVAVHERHSIGTDRGMQHCEMSRIVEALAPGIDRYVWLTDVDTDVFVADRVVAGQLHNCGGGPTHMLAGGTVKAFEFTFGRPLAVGERHAFGYSIDYDAARRPDAALPVAETEVLMGLWVSSVSLSLQVEFAPGVDPVDLRRVEQPTLDGPVGTVAALELSAFRVAGITIDHPSNGVYGIRWAWPDA